MGLYKDQIVADITTPSDGDTIVSYMFDGDGNKITSSGNALDINIASQDANVTVDGTVGISGSVTVTATDLDIRDLVHTQDSIAIGDGASLILDMVTEDAAAAGGEIGIMPMGIRQDAAGSPVSADGDYHPFVFNNDGELKVAADLNSSVSDDAADSGNPIKIGGRGVDGALSALSASNDRFDLLGDMYRRLWVNESYNVAGNYGSTTVGITAVEIASTPTAGRKYIEVQNLGSKPVYYGYDSSVTTSNGMRISRGAVKEIALGEDLNLWMISGTAGQDIRYSELG